MKLRDVTRKFIARLEEKSGYIVTVREDPTLPVLATILIARGTLPAHVLTYKPGFKGESPDFMICWQCAITTRMFECPPDQRFQIMNSPEGNRALDNILNAPNGIANKLHLGKAEIESFKSQLMGGILTHLRSVPIGLRVSDNLTVEFPELLEYESQHVEKELEIGKQSLAPSVKQSIPPEIYNASQAITAAYALYWAERLESPEIARPFDMDNFSGHGQQLLSIFNTVPDDVTNDNELIDRWADYLGIRNWYTWMPYQAP